MLVLRNIVACLVLLWSLAATEATAVPNASVIGGVSFNLGGGLALGNNFGSVGLVDARFGSVGLTVSGTPSPSVVASAHIGPNNLIPLIFGQGSGALTYFFEIVGPAGAVPVLIDVAGAATGLATPGASFAVEAAWSLVDPVSFFTALANDTIHSGQLTGTFSQDFDRTVSLMLITNHTYLVGMDANAGAAASDLGSNAIADAFIDPIFSFGPGVDPQLYAFNFSNGIGNAPAAAVPLPGTLALLSAGLLSLTVVRWRRTAWCTMRGPASA